MLSFNKGLFKGVFRKLVSFLVPLLLVVALILIVIFGYVFNEIHVENGFNYDFCSTTYCIEKFTSTYSKLFSIFRDVFYLFVGLAALVSAVSAVLNYDLSVRNSIFNNHLANFKLFSDFIDSELVKVDMISPKSIDKYKLYRLIYPNSRHGVFDDFSLYDSKICDLKNIILSSSNQYKLKNEKTPVLVGKFNYNLHQHEMKEVLSKLGIDVSIHYRNEFNEMETQILKFIDVITKTFTSINLELEALERRYL